MLRPLFIVPSFIQPIANTTTLTDILAFYNHFALGQVTAQDTEQQQTGLLLFIDLSDQSCKGLKSA